MSFSIYFGTGNREEARAGHDVAIGLEPTGLDLKVHHNLGLLGEAPEPLPQEVAAFLITAVGVWAADKIAPRHQAPDAWTRRLRLSLPVPGWSEVLTALSSLVGFLTGDDWALQARPVQPSLRLHGKPEGAWQPDCVCLFSGGVDSLSGAIDLLETGHRVLLVSHYDFGQLAASQNFLADRLIGQYGPDMARRWGFRIQFEAPELSLRSRSLLFIALGLAAAAVWGRKLPLIIPENGWISLNPPLTGCRLGSYSTRTTHPYFISGLQLFLTSLGLDAALSNPYQYVTKGEMLTQNRNPALLQDLLPSSISCAHPVASRWKKARQGNCGYCFPCLLRRAALHSLGWDDGREYLFDVLQQPEILASRSRGADLRSLLYLLGQWQRHPQPQQLLWQTGPLPADPEIQERLADVLADGLTDLSRWFDDKGADFLKQYRGY